VLKVARQQLDRRNAAASSQLPLLIYLIKNVRGSHFFHHQFCLILFHCPLPFCRCINRKKGGIIHTPLQDALLTLSPSKCQFAVADVNYLGHHVGLDCVQPRQSRSNPFWHTQLRLTEDSYSPSYN